MAQCVKCGKKSFFLKVNAKGICEKCEQAERNAEMSTRQAANVIVQYMLRTAESIQENVTSIVDAHENGEYSKENVELAIQMLQIATDEVKKSVEAVKSAPADQLKEMVEASNKIVLDFDSKVHRILLKSLDNNPLFTYRRHYKVVGTSFHNDDGTARQGILRRIKYAVPEYVCPTIAVKQFEYGGEPAFAVCANDIRIGSIAKDDVAGLLEIADDIVDANIKVFGGDDFDKNCGAEVILTFKK